MYRRGFLAASGAVAAAGLAGCSSLSFSREELSLTVINRDDTLRRVGVDLLLRNADELDRARVYSREIAVPAASDDGPSVVRRDDVVESRPYVVRVDLVGRRERVAPYHFYPDCAGESGPEERLYVDLVPTENGVRVGFDQNGC